MKLFKGIDAWVYNNSKKPKHYKEVHNPPKTDEEKRNRPQDARQIQYNNWSKFFQVYSGSYLPYQAKELSCRGWIVQHKSNNSYETEHIRKSTGQHVLRHGRHVNVRGVLEPTHYHWKNPKADSFPKKQKNSVYYYDKFGDECARGSYMSHIKPHKTRRKK
jgi:hypothetical protein